MRRNDGNERNESFRVLLKYPWYGTMRRKGGNETASSGSRSFLGLVHPTPIVRRFGLNETRRELLVHSLTQISRCRFRIQESSVIVPSFLCCCFSTLDEYCVEN